MTIGDEHMQSILFIVPFAELADNAKKVIRRMGLDIEVCVAFNEKAVEIAKLKPDKTILISRGGTANDLKKYQNER